MTVIYRFKTYLLEKEVQDRKIEKLKGWQRYTNVTGYGSKIPTKYMLKIKNRWRRVYCICYSNVGSLYILKNKRRYYLDGETQSELFSIGTLTCLIKAKRTAIANS